MILMHTNKHINLNCYAIRRLTEGVILADAEGSSR